MSQATEQLLREEHLAVRETARKFALERVAPGAGARDEAEQFPTDAVRENGGFRVNGTKIYITNGSVASTVVFTARTDKSRGTKGISSFIVDTKSPGFKVGKHERKMGLRSSDTVELHFADLYVPADQLLGEE